ALWTPLFARVALCLCAGGWLDAMAVLTHPVLGAVTFTGPVSQVNGARSDAYFATRGRGSRIGAWASAQSRPLDSRDSLAAAVADIEARFPHDVPRPPHWGGFLIAPQEIEFWADGEHRLHDRFRFTPAASDGWDIQRLNP
ncbi:MAG: pyridoxal 5'-phosphate synthase, partial [Pseudomonadota bacterium]|nr:pyridoxal 5'-phosphate synthase [Pseudomonadota bacterium]